MVAPLHADYSNRKGIYKNLYMEIDADNKKKKASEASSRRSPKGIYKNLYEHIEGFKGQENKQRSPLYIEFIPTIQRSFGFVFARASAIFSSAGSEIKMLILACLIAKKPINNYIENNINYLNQGYQDGR